MSGEARATALRSVGRGILLRNLLAQVLSQSAREGTIHAGLQAICSKKQIAARTGFENVRPTEEN